MAGVLPRLQMGPTTYEVNVAVTGGQLVEPDAATGKIKPAGAASLKVLGVAANDAAPAGSGSALNYGTNRPDVAVYSGPHEVRVTYAAAATFGAKLIAAANGQVTPAGATPDAASLVGVCTEPAGVAAAGVGRARLF